MILSRKGKIFSRIYFRKHHRLNIHKTRQSLVPNTIHCYDASIIHLVVQICKKLNIKVLVIHDSIGCSPITVPLVKVIFKVANIMLLDINNNKIIFPLNHPLNINQKNLEELFEKILKSKNFFK
jgi:DNA-directed RNA polymerase